MSKSRNEITGDTLITKAPSEKFSNGWDAIWGKKKPQEAQTPSPNETVKDSAVNQTH